MFLLLLSPAAGGAATLVVDNDRVQCPAATYTTIQSAIDAAAAYDVIRVCAGVYRHADVNRHFGDKDGIKLRAKGRATIRGGVHIVADDVEVSGFGSPGRFAPASTTSSADSRVCPARPCASPGRRPASGSSTIA